MTKHQIYNLLTQSRCTLTCFCTTPKISSILWSQIQPPSVFVWDKVNVDRKVRRPGTLARVNTQPIGDGQLSTVHHMRNQSVDITKHIKQRCEIRGVVYIQRRIHQDIYCTEIWNVTRDIIHTFRFKHKEIKIHES